jgi:hypothetical protein
METSASEIHLGTLETSHYNGGDLEHPFSEPVSQIVVTGLRLGVMAWKLRQKFKGSAE